MADEANSGSELKDRELQKLITLQGRTIPDGASPMATLREAEDGETLQAGSTGRKFTLDARETPAESADAGYLTLSDEVALDDAEPGKGPVNARQMNLGRTLSVVCFDNVADTAAAERFHLEALTTALLEHPNITPVHGYQALPDGRQIMEIQEIRGRPWEVILTEQKDLTKVSLNDKLDNLNAICDALAFAHSRGILHAGLTPERVMIGQFGEILVGGWSQAIRLPNAPPHLSDLRSPAGCHKPEGDPRYIAPELLRASTTEIGTATDVYHLGGLLYRILVDCPPHAGKSASEQTACAIKGGIVRPRKIRPEIPTELERITMKALSLSPDKRYESVAAFKQALADYRKHAGSLSMSAAAWVKLRTLKTTSVVDMNERYSELEALISSFQQSLALWPENREAAQGLYQTRLNYFRTALSNEDLQMARLVSDTLKAKDEIAAYDPAKEKDSVCDAGDEEGGERLNQAELESELAGAWARRRRQHKILGYAAVAMLIALIVGVMIPMTVWMTMKDPQELIQAEQQVMYTLDMMAALKESPDLRKAVEALHKSPNPQVKAKAQHVLDVWSKK